MRPVGVVVLLLVSTVLLRWFVARGFLVEGDSMEPTLYDGDFLLVNRAATGSVVGGIGWRIPGYAIPKRNDVLVLRVGSGPGPRLLIAKRVVGLPGDRVGMRNGALWVNDRLVEEPFVTVPERHDEATIQMEWQIAHVDSDVDPARYFPTRGNWGPLRVPSGRYFVLGDRRDHSIDSRELGFVPFEDVVGRVDRVLLSHDGSCCRPAAILSGLRWERFMEGLSAGR